jgi:hypothetical protein
LVVRYHQSPFWQGLKEISSRAHIGVKRMGELDSKPFLEAMKRKYNNEEAEDRASEICSLWEEYLKDPDWHPFKVVMVDGKHQVCLPNWHLFVLHIEQCCIFRCILCFQCKKQAWQAW